MLLQNLAIWGSSLSPVHTGDKVEFNTVDFLDFNKVDCVEFIKLLMRLVGYWHVRLLVILRLIFEMTEKLIKLAAAVPATDVVLM